MSANTKRNEKRLLPRLTSIVAGFFVGGVFYFLSWFILIKGLHFPVEQFFHFTLNNWQFWTLLLLLVYIGEWILYFSVSSKIEKVVLFYSLVIMIFVYILLWLLVPGLQQLSLYQKVFFWLTCLALYVSAIVLPFIIRDKVWTLRRSIGDHVNQYLNEAGLNEDGEKKLKELREKASVTKHTVAVLLSLSGVVVSIYISGWLSKPELDPYQKLFFYFMGLALISALAPLFVSLEALDTAVNPLFDTGKKEYLKRLYSRGTRWYLVGLACFMFSLLCGLAIVEVLISLIGTILFLIFTLSHNYHYIEN